MGQDQAANPAEMYHKYLVPGIHARWTPLFLDYAEPSPGERVLDVACGTGIVTRSIAPLVTEDGAVTGTDISPEMLTVARGLPAPDGAAIDWQQDDACVSVPKGPFDLATCQQGLQFFPDRAEALRHIRRELASDGRAVLSVFRGLDHHPVYEALITAEARYLDTSIESVAAPFSLGRADELHELFDEAGFQAVEISAESHPVRFPEPERFVALTVLAAASLMPDTQIDDDARNELVQTVRRKVDPVLQSYIEGDEVTFPMHAHIAVAHP